MLRMMTSYCSSIAISNELYQLLILVRINIALSTVLLLIEVVNNLDVVANMLVKFICKLDFVVPYTLIQLRVLQSTRTLVLPVLVCYSSNYMLELVGYIAGLFYIPVMRHQL